MSGNLENVDNIPDEHIQIGGVETMEDGTKVERQIDINPESKKILVSKIKEAVDKEVFELNVKQKEDFEKAFNEMAESFIKQVPGMNIPSIAQMAQMGEKEVKEPATETPLLDRMKMLWYGKSGNTEMVHKLMEPYRKKDQVIGTDASGGYIVPTEDSTSLIDLTVNDDTLSSMCMQYRLKTNTVNLPTLTTNPTVYTVAESTDAGTSTATTESTAVFGQVTLTVYRHGVFIQISNELLEDSDPQIEPILRKAVQNAIGNGMDWSILHGNGTAGAAGSNSLITGMDSLVASGNIISSGGALSYDLLVDMLVAEDYTGGPFAYVTNPFVRRGIMKMKDNDGRPIFERALSSKDMPSVIGQPLRLSRNVSKTLGSGSNETAIYGGAWSSSAWCGVKSGVSIIIDPYTVGEYNSTRFIVNYRAGFQVSSGNHFSKLSGLPGS